MLVLGREQESPRLPVIFITSNDIFHHPEFTRLFLFFLHSLSKWCQDVSGASLISVFIIQGTVINSEKSPYSCLSPVATEPWLSSLTARNLINWLRCPEKWLPRFYGWEALWIRRPPPNQQPIAQSCKGKLPFSISLAGHWSHVGSFKAWCLHADQLNQTLVAQLVKNRPAMQETLVWSLGREDPLEKG